MGLKTEKHSDLEDNLFDADSFSFLDESNIDFDLEYKKFTEHDKPKTPLERLIDYSRWCCNLSEICSAMRMNLEELDKLAQSGGFEDADDLMEYYQQETLDMCFDGIKASAAGGNSKSKAFLKHHLPRYEMQKRR